MRDPLERPTSSAPRRRYDLAQRFLPWNASRYAPNSTIDHHWIGTTDTFWFLEDIQTTKRFVIFDGATGERRPAFDHDRVALQLTSALGEPVAASSLPFDGITFTPDASAIRFEIGGVTWECSLVRNSCRLIQRESLSGVTSPDGRWIAFRRGHNVWVNCAADGTERQLTFDGDCDYGYGTFVGTEAGAGFYAEDQSIPAVLWSPDSKRLMTHRLDERRVLELDLLEMAPVGKVRPVRHTIRYAMPGDEHKPLAELFICDLSGAAPIAVRHEPLVITGVGIIEDDRVWWSANSSTAYLLPREEGQRRAQLMSIDAMTGECRIVIEENCDTYIEAGGYAFRRDTRTLRDGRILWYSERDDWGHLYLYGSDGVLHHRLTEGPWKVRCVTHVDESAGLIYFMAGGRESGEDPYLQHLYVVGIDGMGLTLLTPENAQHEVYPPDTALQCLLVHGARDALRASFSPTGSYFLDSYSRPDQPSVTVLRSTSGSLVAVVASADVSPLELDGFTLPQPFSVKAADGQTDLFGTIHRPSDFDPAGSYPVIDVIYPGPQRTETPKSFTGALFSLPQELAELGFIVVSIDGRGTPFRSKSFHDVSYGDIGQAGNLEDHMLAIRELGRRYAYLDLARVGITGHSGGGYASARAILMYPDFYKVAVAISGNHDLRGYLLLWGPTYQGPFSDTYESLNNASLAANLKGKLLLMHGELDYNVHPAHTMQLVDALIKANKDFECLIVPGEDHEPLYARMDRHNYHVYILRKTWDFFVRHLAGVTPPNDYRLSGP